MSGSVIKNIGLPTSNSDVATKAYVDNEVGWKLWWTVGEIEEERRKEREKRELEKIETRKRYVGNS